MSEEKDELTHGVLFVAMALPFISVGVVAALIRCVEFLSGASLPGGVKLGVLCLVGLGMGSGCVVAIYNLARRAQ